MEYSAHLPLIDFRVRGFSGSPLGFQYYSVIAAP